MSRPARSGRTFLLEIGTEEIPARMVAGALASLAEKLTGALEEHHLRAGDQGAPAAATYGTPRRLAVVVPGLLERQPDRVVEVTGPPTKAAYDADGAPTRAAHGFARAQGIAVDQLRRIRTPKGECVGLQREVRGATAAEVLVRVVPPLVESMTFPKMMRWGNGEHRFVRPVHSVLALLDDVAVDLTIAGIRSAPRTFGHRFAGQRCIPLSRESEYLDALRRNGVVADIAERRRMIEEQIEQQARLSGGRVAPPTGTISGSGEGGDPALLEEVVQLIEWPLVVAGEFDPAFLELPPEILVTAMRHHQKYFALLAPDGTLQNRFLAVANCASDKSGAISRGNAWVLHARLADARFFWDDDRKKALADRLALLERVTFHTRLGNYRRKTERIARLVEALLPSFNDAGWSPDREALIEAAGLSKVDLTTQMVGEFPELQGIVGALYARAEGRSAALAGALYEQYLPAGADDRLPETPEAAILSLADRLDTQAGIFLLGLVPTGSSDPYGLRRSVLGACRILNARGVHVNLEVILVGALGAYKGDVTGDTVPLEEARATLFDFYRARLQFIGEAENLRQDSARAALAVGLAGPFDAMQRMRALDAIRGEAGFDDLATAHKRIKKIIQGQESSQLQPELLQEAGEHGLHEAYETARAAVVPAVARRDYMTALRSIARLRTTLDRFFEEVMVMAEDPRLRANRLALLQSIAGLFQQVGDFSELTVESAPATVGRQKKAS
jgi:glycyl-tRNA synthetase beta chain